jgi:ATP-dependent protease ClpP protease subunit
MTTTTPDTTQLTRTAFVFNGLINSELDSRSLSALITEFLELNADNTRPLLLRISCSGGIPEQVFALCGLLREVKRQNHPVHVHILGQLCKFSNMVAHVADKVFMEPSASLTFEQYRCTITGTPAARRNDLKYRKELFAKLCRSVVARSNNKLKLKEVMSWKSKHLTAQEAFELGLCDEVLPMPARVVKATESFANEYPVEINNSFTNVASIFKIQISLNDWMERSKNAGRPIRVVFTSWGGTVVQALSLYGLLCQAQREGHHVTVQVVGEAYSCALWFATLALNSGEVLIDRDTMFMFHAPSNDNSGTLEELDEMLLLDEAVFGQTCSLLRMIKGFTDEKIVSWSTEPDRYMTAQEVVAMGMGKLV